LNNSSTRTKGLLLEQLEKLIAPISSDKPESEPEKTASQA
jgi:hypothetical protein